MKTLTLATPYPVPTSGLYYVGVTVVAVTPPNIRCVTTNAVAGGVAPILAGSSSTGLTDPASAPTTAVAITATGNVMWAYAS